MTPFGSSSALRVDLSIHIGMLNANYLTCCRGLLLHCIVSCLCLLMHYAIGCLQVHVDLE
jgi:hypothetical protein